MKDSSHISIRVLSQPRYLAVIRAAVEAAATKSGFTADMSDRIVLAVDEAVTNVIRHGYKGRTDQPIWLKMRPVNGDGKEGMEFLIEDECTGVDLAKIKGRPLEEVRPGGLGVHIITGVMDQVEYRSRPDGTGVQLRMVKYKKPAAAAAKG